jgi:hypothetical protein
MSSEYFLRQIDEARGDTHHYTELASKARDKLDLEFSRRPEDGEPEVQVHATSSKRAQGLRRPS